MNFIKNGRYRHNETGEILNHMETIKNTCLRWGLLLFCLMTIVILVGLLLRTNIGGLMNEMVQKYKD